MRTLSEIHQILQPHKNQLQYNKKPTSIFETMLKFASLSLAVARRCAPRHPYKYRLFSTARPFRILGLQQIAVGALEKEPLTNLWVNVFGLPRVNSFVSASENVDEDILSLGEPPYAVEVDLMTPLDADKSPKVHSPALNHIGLWVDDLESAVSWMQEKGVRFTPGGIRPGASGHNVTFIHPKGNEASPIGGAGVLIELVQAPADVIAALSPDK